jgi:hypothetical protein
MWKRMVFVLQTTYIRENIKLKFVSYSAMITMGLYISYLEISEGKHYTASTRLHSARTQKPAIFILAKMRT